MANNSLDPSENLHVAGNHNFGGLDFTAEGAPTGITLHGFAIRFNGVRVGRLQSFTSPTLGMHSVLTRELNPATSGQPVDHVPGGEMDSSFQFGMSRAEVWGLETPRLAGIVGQNPGAIGLLIAQKRPFVVDEEYYQGQRIYRQIRYYACYFTTISKTAFQADLAEPRVIIDGTVSYGNRVVLI